MGLKLEEKMILGCVWLEGGILLFSVGVRGGCFSPSPHFSEVYFFSNCGLTWENTHLPLSPPAPTTFLFFFPFFSFSRLNVRVFLCKNEDIFSYKLFFFFNVIGGHENKFIQTPFSIHSFSFSTKQKSFPPPPKPFQSPPFSIPHFSAP